MFGINNNELILKEEEYNDTALFLDKFKFVKYGTTDYYYITDYYGNYLTLSNKTSSTGSSMIVESTINSSYLNYYLWSFVETDSLNVNCAQQETIASNSFKYFNIRVPYKVTYRIAVNTSDIRIVIYDNSTGSAIAKNVTGNQFVDYIFDDLKDYSVRIYNDASYSQSMTIVLKPKKNVFMYGVYDYNEHKIDRLTHFNSSKNDYEYRDIYPVVYSNRGLSDVIYSQENSIFARWIPLDSNYVVVHAHGLPGNVTLYEGINNNQSLNISSMPWMYNVNMALWLCCYSASNTTDDYVSNMARESVVRGADFGVGFKGEIIVNCANTYSKGFAEAIKLGYQGLDIIVYTHDYTKSIEWAAYYTSVLLPALWNPYVYYRNADGDIVYSIANKTNPEVYLDDCENDANNLAQTNFINPSVHLENDNKNYIEIDYFNNKIKLIKIGDILTNIIYNESTYLNDLNQIVNITKNYHSLDDIIILKVDNEIKVIQMIMDNDNSNLSYYDCIEGKYISYNQFIAYSNNFSILTNII